MPERNDEACKTKVGIDTEERFIDKGCGVMSNMCYYPIIEKWDVIRPQMESEEVQQILESDFDKYTMARWGKSFKRGQFPADFEDEDWASSFSGTLPEPFRYVKQGASHWLVNAYLKAAMLVEPDRPWHIIRTLSHSAVWDREDTLFDVYGMALFKRGAPESFVRAVSGTNAQELAPGELLKTYPPALETPAPGFVKLNEGYIKALVPGGEVTVLGAGNSSVTSPPMAGEADDVFSQTFVTMI